MNEEIEIDINNDGLPDYSLCNNNNGSLAVGDLDDARPRRRRRFGRMRRRVSAVGDRE